MSLVELSFPPLFRGEATPFGVDPFAKAVSTAALGCDPGLIVHNEGGVALPLFRADVYAHTDKVGKPGVIANNWELDGGKACERWWFT
ncbi:MAG: biotin/lipoate--protein ligase family protein [Pseudomonadota bacterium]